MSYKSLSLESMVSLSAPLVDEDHEDCRALKADPVGAALWHLIVQAHQGLLTVQWVGPTPERLRELRELARQYDRRHNDVIRAIWYGCVTAEFMYEGDEDKARIRRLRDRMLPDKLMATRLSYRDKAGQAELVASRLTGEDWQRLRGVCMPGRGSMADAVQEWFDMAARLGALEHERSGAPAHEQPTRSQVRGARNRWIRTMRALRDTLRLRDDLSRALRVILQRIDDVAEHAGRKRDGASSVELAPQASKSPLGPPHGEDAAGDASARHGAGLGEGGPDAAALG